MAGTRAFTAVLAVIAIGTLFLELAAWGPLRSHAWAWHLMAFVPLPFAALTIASTLVALAVLWRPLRVPAARLDRAVCSRLVLPLFLVANAAGFWTLRANQTLLGDAWLVVSGLPSGNAFHEREPLATALAQGVYRVVRSTATGATTPEVPGTGQPPSQAPAMDAVRQGIRAMWILSSACGLVFALAAWGLGREIALHTRAADGDAAAARWTQALVALVLVSQGYMALFYGYLEIYAVVALFFALFAWTGLLFLRGRLPFLAPIVVFVAALGLHLAAISLLPPLALLAALALTGRMPGLGRRRAAGELAVGVGLVFLLNAFLSRMADDYSLWKGVRGILSTAMQKQGGGHGITYLLSPAHGRDFANEHALLGPLAAWLCIPALALAATRRQQHGRALAFLGVTAATLLVGCWMNAEPLLGYARDWDLFAPAGAIFTLSGLWVLCTSTPLPARRRLLVAAFLLSAPRLLVWTALGHDEARSAARFAHLPLGQGRTEVALGNWHLRQGRTGEAVQWFERGLRIEPRNANAHVFLGQIRWQQGDKARAVESYLAAVRSRPDKNEYRHDLVVMLLDLGRVADAEPHLATLCRQEPANGANWVELARVQGLLGREDDARRTLESGAQVFEGEVRRRPRDPARAQALGILYARLDRGEDAARAFGHTLELVPDAVDALYGYGAALIEVGRPAEAVAPLQRFVELAPNDPRAAAVRRFLQQRAAGG
jgi:Flp pilus assembly protein TadD